MTTGHVAATRIQASNYTTHCMHGTYTYTPTDYIPRLSLFSASLLSQVFPSTPEAQGANGIVPKIRIRKAQRRQGAASGQIQHLTRSITMGKWEGKGTLLGPVLTTGQKWTRDDIEFQIHDHNLPCSTHRLDLPTSAHTHLHRFAHLFKGPQVISGQVQYPQLW